MSPIYSFLDRFTQQTGALKIVIDYLTNSADEQILVDAPDEENLYLSLCAAIYGGHLKETALVMDYVKLKRKKQLEPCCAFAMKEATRIRAECDAFRIFQPNTPNILNSSFHLYDQKNKVWLPLDTGDLY